MASKEHSLPWWPSSTLLTSYGIAPRRFASSMTLSAGTKYKSACLATNFLMRQGLATRSTLTYSRVIHFILVLHYVIAGIERSDRFTGACVPDFKSLLRFRGPAGET